MSLAKITVVALAACSVHFITAAQASQAYLDDFSQPDGAPQGWVTVHPSVLIKNQALSLAATGGSSSDFEPHAYLGSPAHLFEGIASISADMSFPGNPIDGLGDHGGILLCSQAAKDRYGTDGYQIDYIRRNNGTPSVRFLVVTGGNSNGQEFPLMGSTYEGRWRIDLSDTHITFTINDRLQFSVEDSNFRSGFVGFWCYFNQPQNMVVDNLEVRDSSVRVLRVAGDATGTGDGSTWANAYPELSAALDTSEEGDELWVAGGNYTPTQEQSSTFLLKTGVALYGGFAGTETERDDRDPHLNVTILSGDIGENDDVSKPFGDPLRPHADNSYHVVTLGGETTLDGFIVTGGYADGENIDGDGAGLLIVGSLVTVSNVEVVQNYARQGAGVYLASGSAQFTNTLIAENSSLEGGTVYCISETDLSLLNSTIASNLAATGSAGIHLQDGSTQAITNCIFWNGGGGEAISHDDGIVSPRISYSLIEGAQVPAGTGNLNSNPLFRRPAQRDDRGTPEDPTDDLWIAGSYRLLEASPAIDSGLAAGAPAKDLRGVDRPCGGAVDMGAYEYCEPPDFFVKLPDTEATIGENFQVRVLLDFDHNLDTPAVAAVEGWSYGVCHDPAVLNPVSVSWVGSDTAGMNGGRGPEFVGLSLPGDLPSGAQNGVTIGVIVDYSPPFDARLPAVNEWRDAVITYSVAPGGIQCAHSGDTRTTQISVCDTLDLPRIRVIMTVNSESLPVSSLDSAIITLRCPTLFRRGDSTRDGFIDISDAICILAGLFGFDETSPCLARIPECLKAIDINDDGAADITDPIVLLTALFGAPPPIPPLTGLCQFDATGDGLSCLSYPSCQ